jgi:hypothetical protein
MGYAFLLDEDVRAAKSLFPKGRAKTVTDLGLRSDAADREVVLAAWEGRYIIVTGNADDFIPEIMRFLKKTKKAECHELFGLVVLPNGYLTQKRILGRAANTLRFGGRKLTWADIWRDNYFVRVGKSGSPEVKRFPRCQFCRKLELNTR